MMETHLAYPLLAYYRSQHIGQSWLSALTAIVDTSAVVLAAAEDGAAGTRSAELTFKVGRHALADLAHQLADGATGPERELAAEDAAELRGLLEPSGLPLVPVGECRERLDRLRRRVRAERRQAREPARAAAAALAAGREGARAAQARTCVSTLTADPRRP